MVGVGKGNNGGAAANGSCDAHGAQNSFRSGVAQCCSIKSGKLAYQSANLSGFFMLRAYFVSFIDLLYKRLFDYRSEEHTSELQSLMRISYAVFCLKKKKIHIHKIE